MFYDEKREDRHWTADLGLITDEEAYERERAMDRAAYEQMKDRLRADYPGQYVAIAFGKLVATSTDFDQAIAAIRSLSPRPQHFLVFESDREPVFDEAWDTYMEFQ